IDNTAAIDTWWQRALVPRTVVSNIKKYCNLSYYGPLRTTVLNAFDDNDDNDPALCDKYVNQATAMMGDVSIYDIYADVCVAHSQEMILKQLVKAGLNIYKALLPKASRRK
ncbi:MAG: hypothetical protein CUN55_20910, partial [Phototrophicales bacterium]